MTDILLIGAYLFFYNLIERRLTIIFIEAYFYRQINFFFKLAKQYMKFDLAFAPLDASAAHNHNNE
jgi:hypothetical protein